MSFNSKAYLADRERLLEPDSVIHTGTYRRYTTTLAAKWNWIDSLTPDQRRQLADDFDNETKNKSNDW